MATVILRVTDISDIAAICHLPEPEVAAAIKVLLMFHFLLRVFRDDPQPNAPQNTTGLAPTHPAVFLVAYSYAVDHGDETSLIFTNAFEHFFPAAPMALTHMSLYRNRYLAASDLRVCAPLASLLALNAARAAPEADGNRLSVDACFALTPGSDLVPCAAALSPALRRELFFEVVSAFSQHLIASGRRSHGLQFLNFALILAISPSEVPRTASALIRRPPSERSAALSMEKSEPPKPAPSAFLVDCTQLLSLLADNPALLRTHGGAATDIPPSYPSPPALVDLVRAVPATLCTPVVRRLVAATAHTAQQAIAGLALHLQTLVSFGGACEAVGLIVDMAASTFGVDLPLLPLPESLLGAALVAAATAFEVAIALPDTAHPASEVPPFFYTLAHLAAPILPHIHPHYAAYLASGIVLAAMGAQSPVGEPFRGALGPQHHPFFCVPGLPAAVAAVAFCILSSHKLSEFYPAAISMARWAHIAPSCLDRFSRTALPVMAQVVAPCLLSAPSLILSQLNGRLALACSDPTVPRFASISLLYAHAAAFLSFSSAHALSAHLRRAVTGVIGQVANTSAVHYRALSALNQVTAGLVKGGPLPRFPSFPCIEGRLLVFCSTVAAIYAWDLPFARSLAFRAAEAPPAPPLASALLFSQAGPIVSALAVLLCHTFHTDSGFQPLSSRARAVAATGLGVAAHLPFASSIRDWALLLAATAYLTADADLVALADRVQPALQAPCSEQFLQHDLADRNRSVISMFPARAMHLISAISFRTEASRNLPLHALTWEIYCRWNVARSSCSSSPFNYTVGVAAIACFHCYSRSGLVPAALRIQTLEVSRTAAASRQSPLATIPFSPYSSMLMPGGDKDPVTDRVIACFDEAAAVIKQSAAQLAGETSLLAALEAARGLAVALSAFERGVSAVTPLSRALMRERLPEPAAPLSEVFAACISLCQPRCRAASVDFTFRADLPPQLFCHNPELITAVIVLSNDTALACAAPEATPMDNNDPRIPQTGILVSLDAPRPSALSPFEAAEPVSAPGGFLPVRSPPGPVVAAFDIIAFPSSLARISALIAVFGHGHAHSHHQAHAVPAYRLLSLLIASTQNVSVVASLRPVGKPNVLASIVVKFSRAMFQLR
jgi:hypothetical protein